MSLGFVSEFIRRLRPRGDGLGAASAATASPTSETGVMDERLISLRCAEAREEERRRIAVDLHDGPIQQLANLIHRLDIARTEMASLHQLAKSTLHDMRLFMFELRPSSLEEFSLLPVLRQYVQDYRAQYHIPVGLHLSDSDWSLGRDIEVNLFRIIQEALTNVRKHANASQVDVILSREDPLVKATVRDNGQGFDVSSTRTRAQRIGVGCGFGSVSAAALAGRFRTYASCSRRKRACPAPDHDRRRFPGVHGIAVSLTRARPAAIPSVSRS